MRIRYALFVTILAVAGCAPGAVLVEEPEDDPGAAYPNHSLSQIIDRTAAIAARDSLLSYTSQARLALRSPEQNADGTAILRQRGGDVLWASLRGPLNIEVVRALVTPDSFHVHDRLRNRLYLGPAAAAQQLFPGPADTFEAFRSLTGTLLPDPDIRWFVNASTLDGNSIYWLTAPDGRTRIAVDPVVWRIRRFERLGASGEVIDRRLFADFQNVEGRILPHLVELSNPAEDTFLTLEHRRFVLNPDGLTFPFDPAGATQHPLTGPIFID